MQRKKSPCGYSCRAMQIKFIKFLLCSLIGVGVLSMAINSCDTSVSPKQVGNIKIHRFDKALQAFDTNHFDASERKMLEQFGDLYPFYIEQLMGLGNIDKNSPYYYKPSLSKFLSAEYPSMMDSIEKYIGKDISEYEKQLSISYSHLQSHFPEKKSSQLYSFFVSPMAANAQAAFSYGNDTIGINWFNYLGKDFSLYKPLYEGYSYMIEWNQPQYLSRNVMLVEYNLLYEKYGIKEEYSELIYNMIEKGKQYYFLDKVCPSMDNATKIGYTPKQYDWCINNELEIWAYFKENKMLYSTEVMDVKRLTEEGPTTPGMPSESPGMVGAWVGWQIVKSYMDKENKNLKELLATSPKDIMVKSSYKPKK